MLYLKLKASLPNDRAALAAMQDFAGFGATVFCWKSLQDDGSASTRYAVMVPGGRRPESIIKQLRIQAPHSAWVLVDVDADGAHTPVIPEPMA